MFLLSPQPHHHRSLQLAHVSRTASVHLFATREAIGAPTISAENADTEIALASLAWPMTSARGVTYVHNTSYKTSGTSTPGDR